MAFPPKKSAAGSAKPKGLSMMEDLASAMSQAKSHAPIPGALPQDPNAPTPMPPCPHCGSPLPPPKAGPAAPPLPPRR